MNKLLLVTGASRAIGAATARLAAAQAVAGAARQPGRRALTVPADVANEAQVCAMFTALGRHTQDGGSVQARLVNNAGVVDLAARVNAVRPGIIDTDIHARVRDGVYQSGTEGEPVFVEVPVPTDEALQAVLHKNITRATQAADPPGGVLFEEQD